MPEALLTSDEIDELVRRRALKENIYAITDRVLATLVAQRDEIARLKKATAEYRRDLVTLTDEE